MKVTQKISKKLKRTKPGTTFNYQQLPIELNEFAAAAKAMERFVKKGIIKRVSSGVFYKPVQSVFGELQPADREVIRLYLFENGKRVAYLTGPALYNQLGLTTQMAFTYTIASRSKRINPKIKKIKTYSVKSYVDVTNKNFRLLGLLDALKDFNKIMDINRRSAIIILTTHLKKLTLSQQKEITKYALSYPPRTRAFLGALFENIDINSPNLKVLENSLNPFSEFRFLLNTSILPTVKNWNIK